MENFFYAILYYLLIVRFMFAFDFIFIKFTRKVSVSFLKFKIFTVKMLRVNLKYWSGLFGVLEKISG